MSAAIMETPGFSPLQIPGIKSGGVWVKADAGTFQTSGGAAAIADADPIGEWQDQSGSGNHLGITLTQRPLLKLNIKNNRSVVRFDGVNDVLTKTLVAASAWSFFIVAKAVTSIDGGRFFAFGGAGGLNLQESAGAWNFYSTEAGGAPTLGGNPANWGLISFVFASNSSADARVNGGTLTSFDPIDFNAYTVLTLGAASAAGGNPHNCDIAEFIATPAAVSDQVRAQTEAYLNSRWGVY